MPPSRDPRADAKLFVEDCFVNASDLVYSPADLKGAARRYIQAQKIACAEDSSDLQGLLAEVVTVAAGLWKQLNEKDEGEDECPTGS